MSQPSSPCLNDDVIRDQDDRIGFFDILVLLAENRVLVIYLPLVIGLIVFFASGYIKPTFTATTVIVPPQQQQSTSSTALQSLGGLAGLAGAAAGIKNPIDQYIALMRSNRVSDRVVEKFNLAAAYGVGSKNAARRLLAGKVRITSGVKDGLMTIEVDDANPELAAEIANNYVEQLKRVTGEFAITEAQQRRSFFERQLEKTKDKLAIAQRTLQLSGINQGALRAEPKAAADTYAGIKAQVTAAEVKLQGIREYATEEAPEFKSGQSNLIALKTQLAKLESAASEGLGSDYISKYRDYKYQENLFDLFSRQFELAKLDESRDGAVIQVVDVATPPDQKSKPMRGRNAILSALLTLIVMFFFVLIRDYWRKIRDSKFLEPKLIRMKHALAKAGKRN